MELPTTGVNVSPRCYKISNLVPGMNNLSLSSWLMGSHQLETDSVLLFSPLIHICLVSSVSAFKSTFQMREKPAAPLARMERIH